MGIYDNAFNKLAADQRIINHIFQRDVFCATERTIAGDDELGIGILQAVSNALCTETTKNDGVNGSDPCTSQNGNRQFWNHSHINADTIAFFDPIVLEYIGKLVHLGMQLRIGEQAVVIIRIIGFPDDGWLVGLVYKVPVNTVFGDVEFRAAEPFDGRLLEIPIQDLVPGLLPLKMAGHFPPKIFRIFNTFLPCFLVTLVGRNLIWIAHIAYEI